MLARCCPLIILIISLIVCSTADENLSHKLVKRQFPPRPGGARAFPLSRSRQFPPPESVEESEEEYDTSEEEEPRAPAPSFRGRQSSSSDDYSDEQTATEAPKITTPTPEKSTSRTNIFNSRVNSRPKFGANKPSSTTQAPSKPSTASSSNPRFRSTPAQSQRLDVVANILNKPPPPRSSSRAISPSRTANENSNQKLTSKSPAVSDQVSRRSESGAGARVRMRGRPRARSSTTTTTTTTTQAVPEEYYYYYEDDDEAPKNQPIATTTSTTTTTTTPRPSLPKRPSLSNRRPTADRNSRSTSRPVIKFDPESQFQPPPDDPVDINPTNNRLTSNRNSKPTPKSALKFDLESQFQSPPDEAVDVKPVTSATKRFTTSTTTEPPGGFGDIPVHLRNKYKPRKDGRFIDFLRDPNRPRELKGFDLTDYPFYVKVPEDIVFDCEDKKDGYYASMPHKCQLFHYCFAGARYDFLCANYTLYDQTTFTCRFANNVDCESSDKYYYRNDDLWKETTTAAPETTTKKRRPPPRDYDYDEEYDYEEYDDEEEQGRRRRPPSRRRNRRKYRRKQKDDEEEK